MCLLLGIVCVVCGWVAVLLVITGGVVGWLRCVSLVLCMLVSVYVVSLVVDSCGLAALWVFVDSCLRGSIAGFTFWILCISTYVGLGCCVYWCWLLFAV